MVIKQTMKSKSIPNWKTVDKCCPLLSCWAVDPVYNIRDSYFTGHKNNYFQLNVNTGHFSFPFRNGSCCHKPKCICDHCLLPWLLPGDVSFLIHVGARMLRLQLFFPLPCFFWALNQSDLHHLAAAAACSSPWGDAVSPWAQSATPPHVLLCFWRSFLTSLWRLHKSGLGVQKLLASLTPAMRDRVLISQVERLAAFKSVKADFGALQCEQCQPAMCKWELREERSRLPGCWYLI